MQPQLRSWRQATSLQPIATIDYTRAMSKALYGRDIPYVLLMHVGALDARMLPRLLKLYRDKGFTFISLQDAEKDPFYKNDLDLSLPSSPRHLGGGDARTQSCPANATGADCGPELICQ